MGDKKAWVGRGSIIVILLIVMFIVAKLHIIIARSRIPPRRSTSRRSLRSMTGSASRPLLRDSFSGTDDTALFESHGKRSKP